MTLAKPIVIRTRGGALVAQRRGLPVLAERGDTYTVILRFSSREAADRARLHWERHFGVPMVAEVMRDAPPPFGAYR